MITQELMKAAVQERLREAAQLRRQREALDRPRGRQAARASTGRWLMRIRRLTCAFFGRGWRKKLAESSATLSIVRPLVRRNIGRSAGSARAQKGASR
jgi:hypothetical protein